MRPRQLSRSALLSSPGGLQGRGSGEDARNPQAPDQKGRLGRGAELYAVRVSWARGGGYPGQGLPVSEWWWGRAPHVDCEGAALIPAKRPPCWLCNCL